MLTASADASTSQAAPPFQSASGGSSNIVEEDGGRMHLATEQFNASSVVSSGSFEGVSIRNSSASREFHRI